MVMKAVEATSASDAVAKLSAAAAKMGIKCSVPNSFAPARHKCDYDYYFYGALKKSMQEEVSSFFFLSWHFFLRTEYIYSSFKSHRSHIV